MRTNLWVALALLLTAASGVDAATVKKIKAPKRLIILDQGSKEGFLKKKKVCFYDANDQKVACGRVRAAKAKASSVLIKKEADVEKITVGMRAEIENIDNKDVKITIDENAPVTVEEGYVAPNYIGLFGAFPVKDAVSYQNLVYDTPLGLNADSMWTQDSAVKAIGVGGEVGFGLKSFTLAIGARTRTFSPKRVSADYDNKDGDFYFEEYVESIGTGKSLGYWLDFYYLRWDWGVASLNLGNGIDMDSSTVTFTMDHLSDKTTDVTRYYDVKSSLKAMSLRTNLLLDFKFGPVGFKMGTTIFVPVSQQQSISVKQIDPFTNSWLKNKTAEEDVKEKLAHKAQVGMDLLLMGYFAY
ncbi:MAG: hypothetical protein H7318_08650 [Oligoflexus sp.]|nr:hypothetical protein [Oligoflexus sp.]